MKKLSMINKERKFFQYKSVDLVFMILPLTSQLRTTSRKVLRKYIRPVVVYRIIDPKSLLLCTLDGKLLLGLFENGRLKPAVIKTSQDNVTTLLQLKQVLCSGIKFN